MIEATDELIRESGRTWFTVEEVCRAAGYTRGGAFYSSYDTMEDLLFEVYEHQNDALVERLRNTAAPLLRTKGVLETDRVVRQLLKAASPINRASPCMPPWWLVRPISPRSPMSWMHRSNAFVKACRGGSSSR